MRLGLGTVKGKWGNVHLLVSPEDPKHLAELKRFLARLTFKATADFLPIFTENPSQNRLKRITRQASWTKPKKLWAWYSQRMRIRRYH